MGVEIDPMNSLPHLLEQSVQIAWDYLERTGQIHDAAAANRFLGDQIEVMIRRGQRSRLLLSNRAIAAYERVEESRIVHFKQDRAVH